MKKYLSIIFVFMFIFCINKVDAKELTLNDLLKQAQDNRQAYTDAKNQKEMSEKEREKAIKDKEAAEKEITSIKQELPIIEEDIRKLQKSIEIKDKEIKKIMEFVQVSNGESAYIEYAMGAKTFTDFIYRISVAEELSSYNKELIDGFNKDVKKLETKQQELTNKQQELEKKQQELTVLEAKLDAEIEALQEGMLTKDQEYATTISLINNMKQLGCKGNETLTKCQSKLGTPIVSVSGTHLPLAHGYLTSDYGPRTGEFHTGMDFASGKWGENVYPVAAGKVVALSRLSNGCGNHIVYVYHNIGGRGFTTSYWHLISWNVSVGQSVTPNTVIGTIGGLGYTDACASGGHVHLNLFNGLTTNNSGRINPRLIIPQAPREGVYFSSR